VLNLTLTPISGKIVIWDFCWWENCIQEKLYIGETRIRVGTNEGDQQVVQASKSCAEI